MVKQMMAKVPQVQGKLSTSMAFLTKTARGMGVWGKEKLWTTQYLPRFAWLQNPGQR
jgi:hypothetical protein